jgi:nicotinamidase-related amidase
MAQLSLCASYYQQFDADHSLPFPGEACGGWRQAEVAIDPARTALVVMHAWNYFTAQQYPGAFRAEDHLGRANAILENVFPPLLQAARGAGLTVLHVVCGGEYYKNLPGYVHALELAPPQAGPEQAVPDPTLLQLQQFRNDHVFPGAHNVEDGAAAWAHTDFHPSTRPLPGEGIAHYETQLHALCKEAGINHLVYSGFALDACLLMASSGMVDMSRRGYLCSVLREATTSCEMKETARSEGCKELALWRVSVFFGFVFGVANFIEALQGNSA